MIPFSLSRFGRDHSTTRYLSPVQIAAALSPAARDPRNSRLGEKSLAYIVTDCTGRTRLIESSRHPLQPIPSFFPRVPSTSFAFHAIDDCSFNLVPFCVPA